MSLMDTIKAARQEAEEAGSLPMGKKAADQKVATEEETTTPSGFSRRSAARAKPTREAAGSVRLSSEKKPESQMTKEEKKAQKEERRQTEDLVYGTKSALLNDMPEYKHTQRVWWGMLIAGIVLTVVSFALSRVAMSNGEDSSSTMALTSIFMMVAAYVLVIGAFIYDLVKVRPLRKAADEKLTRMSRKRMERYLEESEQ